MVTLGNSHARDLSHLIEMTIDDMFWMVFYIRTYLGVNLFFARFLVLVTVLNVCLLFYFFIASLLFLVVLSDKANGAEKNNRFLFGRVLCEIGSSSL